MISCWSTSSSTPRAWAHAGAGHAAGRHRPPHPGGLRLPAGGDGEGFQAAVGERDEPYGDAEDLARPQARSAASRLPPTCRRSARRPSSCRPPWPRTGPCAAQSRRSGHRQRRVQRRHRVAPALSGVLLHRARSWMVSGRRCRWSAKLVGQHGQVEPHLGAGVEHVLPPPGSRIPFDSSSRGMSSTPSVGPGCTPRAEPVVGDDEVERDRAPSSLRSPARSAAAPRWRRSTRTRCRWRASTGAGSGTAGAR